MKTKRILAMALAAVMCISLASCKKEKLPTAEELLAGGQLTSGECVDANVKLSFEAKVSIAELMGEGNDGTMDVGLGVDANLLYDGEVSHVTGTIGVQMLGMEYGEEMETYSLTTLDGTQKTYTKDADDGTWSVSVGEPEERGNINKLLATDPKLFTDLQLAPVKKGDTVYTVTGQMKATDMMNGTEDFLGFGDTDTSVPDDMAFDVTLVYDRGTKNLQSVKMALDPESGTMDEMEIAVFTLEVIINSTEGVAVEIPADVIENAIDINGPVTFDERATFSDDGSSSAGDGSAVLDPENWEYLPK